MLESGWKRRNEANLLFIWYEELKKDQREVISRIAKHLNIELMDEDIERLKCRLKTVD